MKTFLSVLAVALTTAVPLALTVELAGAPLPPVVDATSAFVGFVTVLVVSTAVMDYSRRPRVFTLRRSVCRADSTKAVHPLAA
jgi:hypothetical protein